MLRDALAELSEQIAVAFVYGSLAQGTGKANSDVDVMVIGDVSFGEVVSAIQPAQKTIGREVNPSVYSEREYRAKLQAKHHFLTSVDRHRRKYSLWEENMSLNDWARKHGWLTEHKTSRQEIADLLGVADRDLADCAVKGSER